DAAGGHPIRAADPHVGDVVGPARPGDGPVRGAARHVHGNDVRLGQRGPVQIADGAAHRRRGHSLPQQHRRHAQERAQHETGRLHTILPRLRVTEEVLQRTTRLDTGRGLQGRARISTRTGEAQAGGNLREKAKQPTASAGSGDDLAEKATAIVTTGELPRRRELAAQLPPGLLDLLRIPGLGAKRVKELHDKLHVTSAADLAEAVEAGKVEELKGFGPKMVEKIRAGLAQAERVERRLLLDEAEAQATALVAYLKAGGGIRDLEVAGSYRRRRETVGDLDVLATCADGTAVMSRFAA